MAGSFSFKWNGGEIAKNMRKAVDLALTDVAVDITRDAIQKAPRFTGNLRRSIAFSPPYDRRGQRAVDVGMRGGDKGEFRYAMAVEYGRPPGKRPPVDALKPWVVMKWGAGKVGNRTGPRSRRMKGDQREKDIASKAFILARHIGEHGTKAQPFLIPAWQRHVHKIQARLKARWAEVARTATL